MPMNRALPIVLVVSCGIVTASADQYWVSYEGSELPENLGWTRYPTNGGAVRYIEDGALVIDSRASIMISDAYGMERPGALDPGPGEVFVMQWRLCIDELIGPWDPVVGLHSDGKRGATLSLGYDYIDGRAGEHGVFEGGVYHAFEFRSADMQHYVVYIDGLFGFSGTFWGPSVTSSLVAWGDVIQGAASLARWDYFRFGVVPEATAGLGCLFAGAVMRRALRR